MRSNFEWMRGGLFVKAGLAFVVAMAFSAPQAKAGDALLAEAVEFTGLFIHLTAKSPGLVIGAIRNGETVVRHYRNAYRYRHPYYVPYACSRPYQYRYWQYYAPICYPL